MTDGLMMPCVPLRGLSIFPGAVLHFDVGREKSINAIHTAMRTDKLVFLVTQKDEGILMPTKEDCYKVGTVARVKQMLKVQAGEYRVLVQGLYRAELLEMEDDEEYIKVCLLESKEILMDPDSNDTKALMRVVVNSFEDYISLSSSINEEIINPILSIKESDVLADTIAMNMDISVEKKQGLLEELSVENRLQSLNLLINEECQILYLEKDINQKVQESVKQNQKEYILREQMKAIQDELGFGEEAASEATRWLEELEKLKLPEKIADKVKREISKFSKMTPSSADGAVIRNYVETILGLPWKKTAKTNSDINKAEKILNEDHYGLEKVKERILEYLAVAQLSKTLKGPIICLVGPPGVGKTSIAKSIARATGRDFVRMSLGGVRDEAEIRGHRRTYIGAIPGRVITSVKDAGTNNPVFLFDEVDKIGSDFKGDPASALLEVLDPEQNKEFTDHFLEVPFDLSKVMFITTANTTETIPRPLLDRMEVIEVMGYTEEEKVKIAERYLIPKQIKANGLKEKNISISQKTIRELINSYTRESGVRNLEREIGSLCRKVARKIVAKSGTSFKVTPLGLESYLGKKKFRYDKIQGDKEVGVVTGMAWTQVGGDTLFVETAVVKGTGKIQLTGKLGDVMQESAKAAITYIRSIGDEFGIADDFYEKYDLHVHVPEGAVPKDGPSAGVTIFTSVLSALTGIPVKKDVAMTGEITLRGKVLPVGGIKEKVLAAHRAGIKTILLPRDNENDIEEIPSNVRRHLEFILLDTAKEVLDYALAKE